MATKKAAPAKKMKAVKATAPVVSPFRAWADRPDSAAISELCEYVAQGGHLAGFVRDKGFAYVTVLAWIATDKGTAGRAEMYARAREDRADVLADEIVAIADEQNTMIKGADEEDAPIVVVFDPTAVARNKLRVDARKWAASKLKPRVYGDKMAIGGAADLPPMQSNVTVSPADAYKAMLGK